MNLQIVSNTSNVININTTNKFEMHLAHSIDALNNKAFIEVTNVCYPSTTKNVLKDTCFIDLEIKFDAFLLTYGNSILVNVKYQNVDVDLQADVKPLTENSSLFLTTKRVNIPEGIYDLQRLLEYINNVYDAYEVFFSIEKNGKVKINVQLDCAYWLLQKTATYTVNNGNSHYAHDAGTLNEFRKSYDPGYMVSITMSEKLAFMLGFKNNAHRFEKNVYPDLYASIYADYLPDVSDGLNKIFVYCDELERVLVGDTSAELLTTIPIQWTRQGNGNGELICYSPSNVKKKFKKADIHVLHISLRDTKGELVPFDSGTVTIDCLIHYA